MARTSIPLVAAVALVATLFNTACETDSGDLTTSLSLEARAATEVLPSSAVFVGMARVGDFASNPAVNPFRQGGWLSSSDTEAAARVLDFLATTDFDPERDVEAVYIAGNPKSDELGPSIVANGTFDRQRILSYVEEKYEDTFQRSDYAGVAIYSGGDGHHAFTFALPSDETLIASSSVTLVQAMIDRISNGGPSLSDDARLMDLIRKVDGQSAWMVTEDVQFQTNGKWSGFSRAIDRAAGGLQVTEDGMDGVVYLIPPEGVAAGDLEDLVRGVVAGVKTSSDLSTLQREALETVRIDLSDGQVVVRFAASNDLLTELRHEHD
jgi:hypothetical protein